MSDEYPPAISQIQQVFASTAVAIAAGADAATVAELLYDEDPLIVGDGMQASIRGRLACVALLTEVLGAWGPRPGVKYSISHPVVASENHATMLTQVDVTPAGSPFPTHVYRAMYAFVRGPQGWRVRLELYGVGPVETRP